MDGRCTARVTQTPNETYTAVSNSAHNTLMVLVSSIVELAAAPLALPPVSVVISRSVGSVSVYWQSWPKRMNKISHTQARCVRRLANFSGHFYPPSLRADEINEMPYVLGPHQPYQNIMLKVKSKKKMLIACWVPPVGVHTPNSQYLLTLLMHQLSQSKKKNYYSVLHVRHMKRKNYSGKMSKNSSNNSNKIKANQTRKNYASHNMRIEFDYFDIQFFLNKYMKPEIGKLWRTKVKCIIQKYIMYSHGEGTPYRAIAINDHNIHKITLIATQIKMRFSFFLENILFAVVIT